MLHSLELIHKTFGTIEPKWICIQVEVTVYFQERWTLRKNEFAVFYGLGSVL